MGDYVFKGRVIDGLGKEPLEDGVVITKGEKIEFVGAASCAEIPPETRVMEFAGGTIMPGFIDCHAHFSGKGSSSKDILSTSHLELILNSAHDIGILLDAGFTGVRDMSLFGLYLAKSVKEGLTRGPRIVPGGRLLSVTAGHGDMHVGYAPQYLKIQDPICYLVDGVDGVIKGVREQFRLGAKFIKISVTGGVSSTVDDLDDIQFSWEEIKAIVEETNRHGTYVAAHCTGNAGTLQALQAGVTSIEHGVFLDERCIELMVKNEATLVPTLSVSLGIPKMRDVLPPHIYERGLKCAEASLKSVEMAKKAGIRICLGTDYSNSTNSPYAENGKEFESMVKGGLSPMESIQAGTRNAAYLMGMEGEVGTLEVGKLADVVLVDGDPIQDISLLSHKDNVKVVMKGGVLEKDIR